MICVSPRQLTLAVVLIASTVLAASPAHGEGPAIAFGSKHALALRTNGEVLTWGENLYCQLGRASSGNRAATPTVIMRNVKEIAASDTHSFALTEDGKVYAWGGNPAGVLGMGDEWERCEGPELVPSLADKTIAHIATGLNFALAVTTSGDLFCSGENDMTQCPAAARGSDAVLFAPVPFPELKGKVDAVRAGGFHALVRTTDGRLYAFGRGRDGQLGNGRSTNGFAAIADLTDVVSFAAGLWHSVAVRADGSAWVWGSNIESQLCDGTRTNRATPTRVAMPGSAAVKQVSAAHHSTALMTADGALYACGDNKANVLGLDGVQNAPVPTRIPLAGATVRYVALGGAYSAVSTDGCAVRLVGVGGDGILTDEANNVSAQRAFAPRGNLTLCAPRPATPQSVLVREWPKGGQSGCWAPRREEDASKDPRFASLRAAMLAAEQLFTKDATFMNPFKPMRYRTTLSAGPLLEAGARMHVKAVPERKDDLTRLWTGTCDVIPQIDRIGGASAHVSIFFNDAAATAFMSATGKPPALTGRIGGFPVYDHWILITKDGRLPWAPQTLGERLDLVAERRERALADWQKSRASIKVPDAAATQRTYEMLKKSDPAGAEKFLQSSKETAAEVARQQQEISPRTTAALEKQLRDLRTYRASFSAAELASAAVPGDPTGAERKKMDAAIAALRNLPPDLQQQADTWGREARDLERQAQAEARAGRADQAAALRARANELGLRVRDLRKRHQEQIATDIQDLMAQYELASLKPGPAEQAIAVKRDAAFPDPRDPNRIQVIAVMVGMDNGGATPRRDWQMKIRETFDYAALAALIK